MVKIKLIIFWSKEFYIKIRLFFNGKFYKFFVNVFKVVKEKKGMKYNKSKLYKDIRIVDKIKWIIWIKIIVRSISF